MVSIIKKILLEFEGKMINNKKIIMIGKEDREDREMFVHYVCKVKGSKRGKKSRIKGEDYQDMKSKAIRITDLTNG